MRIHSFLAHIVLGLGLTSVTLAEPLVDGSFIQLHRGHETVSVDAWRAGFRQLKALGGRTLIVQWAAEALVLYFDAPRDAVPDATEIRPVLEAVFEAAEAEEMTLLLGLLHQPDYWQHIRSRGKVVRDYFRLRQARNVQVQRALLQAFGNRTVWVGYYIPDEIDDLSWRDPERRAWLRKYLVAMTALLRENDPHRTIGISAFFRGRTAPSYMARTLYDITGGTGLDIVMVQDGVGTGDPPLAYVHHYYTALAEQWASADVRASARPPALWGIVETFHQTSQSGKPFAAEPADGARILKQIQTARPHVSKLVLFTYFDYLNPQLGPDARNAFEHLSGTRVAAP